MIKFDFLLKPLPYEVIFVICLLALLYIIAYVHYLILLYAVNLNRVYTFHEEYIRETFKHDIPFALFLAVIISNYFIWLLAAVIIVLHYGGKLVELLLNLI